MSDGPLNDTSSLWEDSKAGTLTQKRSVTGFRSTSYIGLSDLPRRLLPAARDSRVLKVALVNRANNVNRA